MKKLFICVLILSGILHIMIRPSLANEAPPSLTDDVYADLALRNYLSNVSIYMIGQKNNTVIAINQGQQWIPASTIKLYVAMYAFEQIEKGNIRLLDNLNIDAKNVVTTELVTDELPTLREGETVTVERLLKQMIIQSDNTAYNSLIDLLDRRKISTYINSLGLIHSSLGSKLNLDDNQQQYENTTPGYGINTTTADDYAHAFLLIKENKIPGAQSLFTLLKQQKINNMIPSLLPKNTIVAHKTGDWDPLYHDGGIITPENRGSYILSIFTNAGDPTLVAHISQLIYTKNYSLVGQVLSAVDSKPTQEIDSLLLNIPLPTPTPTPTPHVLGLTTNVFQDITAADLGIKATDLSLALSKPDFPKVFIPADSSLHDFVFYWYLAKKLIASTPEKRLKVDIDSLNLQVFEANDLLQRGNKDGAQLLLTNVQNQLTKISKYHVVVTSPSLQTAIEQVSQQRFVLLRSEFLQADSQEKISLIRTIANQARETVSTIEPYVPQAVNNLNPAQHPLIGTVVKKSDSQLVVQTANGPQIIVPINQEPIKIREQSQNNQTTIGTINIGATIALIGSAKGTIFTPSFILTKIPKELIAPQPVPVLKVNTKNNTMIVSVNGLPMQVDLTKQTVIKAGSTNLTLSSIKPGDIVEVHAQPLTNENSSTVSGPTVTTIPSTVSAPSSAAQNKTTVQTSASGEQKKLPSPSAIIPTPNIVVGKSIQVVETTQQLKTDNTTKTVKPEKSQSTSSSQPSNNNPPVPPTNPPAVVVPQASTDKNDTKAKKG